MKKIINNIKKFENGLGKKGTKIFRIAAVFVLAGAIFISGNKNVVKTSLGALRCKLARDLDLIKAGDYKKCNQSQLYHIYWKSAESVL